MLKYFQDLKTLAVGMRDKSISMQNRLILYFLSIVAVIVIGFLILFTATGLFDFSKDSVNNSLDMELTSSTTAIREQFEYMTSQGIKMAGRIGTEIEYILDQNHISFEELKDNSELIEQIEHNIYRPLYSALELSKCSGAYVILNTTLNTQASEEDQYRSGLYIRRISVNDSNPVATEAAVYRGSKEIARKNKLELHSRWEMEFDLKEIDFYKQMEGIASELTEDYYKWTDETVLFETGEKVMYLMIPIFGANDEYYGICGVEISALYFQLSYPSVTSEFGNIVTVLAPCKDDTLELDNGLCGADKRGKFYGNPMYIKEQGDFNYYGVNDIGYIGKQCPITFSKDGTGAENWVVSVLISENQYREAAAGRTQMVVLVFVILLFVLCILSVFLSRRYVRPITVRIAEIQNGILHWDDKTGFSEIDDLVEFLNTQLTDAKLSDHELPKAIQEKFDAFIERTKSLTPAEKNILNYYIEGYQIMDIPEMAYISLNTVKKHNKNIYAKLQVSSKEEVMIYIDLLKKCGKLQEITSEDF